MKKLLYLIPVIVLFACNNKADTINENEIENQKTAINQEDSVLHTNILAKTDNDTILNLTFRNTFLSEIQIMLPTGDIQGNILMLHGWNLPASQWCDSTDFCSEALAQGYALIIPELSLCNYPLEIYPETMEKYRNYPDLPWITDSLIPLIQNETGLLMEGQSNFVAGISTGGRGATLLTYYLPELFTACASLSGDFDITSMQNEFLYIAWFGEYDEFPERWKNECFAYDTKNYNVPTYISHGQIDKVSPCSQSMAMADSIRKNNPGLIISSHFPDNQGHNYTFWKNETKTILKFFSKF